MLLLAGVLAGPVRAFAQTPCVGDCGGDGRVTVDDLIKGVNISLSARPVTDCRAFDIDSNDRVTVNELVQGVRASLEGCSLSTPPPSATPTLSPPPATATASATPTSTAETETPTTTPTATRTPGTSRPNIIVVNLDDTRADGIDRMPTLQALAAQGVTFRNSFVPFSVCAPSRASLLTGRIANHHGTRGTALQIGGADTFRVGGADRQTIAVWLQATGYRTGLFGKYINDYGASEANQGPNGTFYVPPGWTRWRAMRSTEHYGGVLGPGFTLIDEHGALTVYDEHDTDAQYSTDLLGAELRTFINESVDAQRPFFAVWTPYASHVDQPDLLPIPAARHLGAFADIVPWRPPSWAEGVDGADPISDKPRWVQALPVSPVIAAITDLMRRRAYETLLSVDEQLALIRQLLDERGIADNTVLIVTSDNGVSWGEHSFFSQGKGCIYEECLRVPLIVHYPRVITQARQVDAPVLNIDVAPTIAALAGVLVPVPVDGRSFAPWLVGASVPSWRQDFLLEFWHELRGDRLTYSGQVIDGDRIQVLYGNPRVHPRPSVTFEFDAGDGNTIGDALAVPIGGDEDASFVNLGSAIAATLPGTTQGVAAQVNRLTITAANGSHLNGRRFVVEVDQGDVMESNETVPDYVGLRDVARGYTYAELETGEVELYDLALDPNQLDNKASDPAFADLRQELAARLEQLVAD